MAKKPQGARSREPSRVASATPPVHQKPAEQSAGATIPGDAEMNMMSAIDVQCSLVGAPSLIVQLHRRYEACSAEYHRIDEANVPEKPGEDDEARLHRFRCEDGMDANAKEQDMLQNLILMQVPTDGDDLSILAFHAWSALDRKLALLDVPQEEPLLEALASIFDYVAGDDLDAIQGVGEVFSYNHGRAFNRIRFRTGRVARP